MRALPIRKCVALAFANLLYGCTTIQVDTDGHVETIRHFGYAEVRVAESDRPTVIRSERMGIAPSTDGILIGWSEETQAYLASSSACQALLIIDSDVQAEFVSRFIDLENICVITEEP